MVEKAIPIVTVRKIDNLRFNSSELDGQQKEFAIFKTIVGRLDDYKKYYLKEYIKKYCLLR